MTVIRFKKFNIDTYKPGRSSIRNIKKVIKLEMDINEIDRALTEIEGGLDRIIDKLSGEDK